jgi:A/G-specific adenine glycosylase
LRAEALLPAEGIESYTQGLMDMGATLCTRSRPQCERCPMQQRCVAAREGRQAELPVKKPKKAAPEKQAVMLIIEQGGKILFEQRPEKGIWGGLLSLPESDGHQAAPLPAGADSASDTAVRSATRFGEVLEAEALLPLLHVFTHYKLHIHPVRVTLRGAIGTPDGHQWWDRTKLDAAPLPAPVRKILAL